MIDRRAFLSTLSLPVGAAMLGFARELASHPALASGDVVTLGRRVADPVVLRAGGVEIARGELIQIEGEVGVRILTRTPTESP